VPRSGGKVRQPAAPQSSFHRSPLTVHIQVMPDPGDASARGTPTSWAVQGVKQCPELGVLTTQTNAAVVGRDGRLDLMISRGAAGLGSGVEWSPMSSEPEGRGRTRHHGGWSRRRRVWRRALGRSTNTESTAYDSGMFTGVTETSCGGYGRSRECRLGCSRRVVAGYQIIGSMWMCNFDISICNRCFGAPSSVGAPRDGALSVGELRGLRVLACLERGILSGLSLKLTSWSSTICSSCRFGC
jgi:hypothetical protein